MQGCHGVVRVVLAAEQGDELELVEVGIEPVEVCDELFLRLGVGRLLEELVEDLGLLDALGELVVERDVRADPCQRAVQVLGALGVVPDAGLTQATFEAVSLRAAAVDVKGTP
jgi:hypothetical protein